MKRAFLILVLIVGSIYVFAVVGAAQTSSFFATWIEPGENLLPVGQLQTFQLLGNDGNEQTSAGWALSDPDIADLRIEEGRAIVTGKAPGVVKLSVSTGAQEAEITVHDGKPPMPQDSRWILQPVDGQFVRALWASGTWGGSAADADSEEDNHAAYFYGDKGRDSSHVRAVREDGLQVWQWPVHRSSETPRVICGDIYGGVLVEVGDSQKRILVDLDASGNERWRVPVPGFSGRDFTYTMNGVLYIVEDDAHMTGARIVGLDAKTGQQKFSLALPASLQIMRNMTVRNDKLICSPGAEESTPLTVRHSKMMSNIEQVANLVYSEFSLFADAGKCTPDSVLDLQKIHIKVTQRLMMVNINDNLTTTTNIVEANTTDGSAGTTWIQSTVPTGDIIVGEQGTGNFLAVRRTRQLWRGTGPGTIEEFQYRITEERTVKYRVPVPLSPLGYPSSMLLGENNLGYTTRGKIVVAFDTETGREKWRWESAKSNVLACAALKDDELLVREGNEYTTLKDGKVENHRAEAYMLFVAKFRPDDESY
jgi:outer membrane protein assembly factor BamB